MNDPDCREHSCGVASGSVEPSPALDVAIADAVALAIGRRSRLSEKLRTQDSHESRRHVAQPNTLLPISRTAVLDLQIVGHRKHIPHCLRAEVRSVLVGLGQHRPVERYVPVLHDNVNRLH